MSRRTVAAGAATLLLAVAAGCGVPASTQPSDIDPDEVPYGLLGPSPEPFSAAGSDLRGTAASTPVYLLADGAMLQPAATTVEPGSALLVGRQALARLEAGPSESERDEGLASALGASVGLSLVGIRDGTARVEVELTAGELAADQVPLALGQVVLTLTAVEGIDRVQLVRGGEDVEMPLPGGALTTQPVTAEDYEELIGPPR